jgi:hypothetical protein
MSLEELVVKHVLRRGRRALPVRREGCLLGIVSITDANEVLRESWPRTAVDAIMTWDPLDAVAPDADVSTALQVLEEGSLNQLPGVTAESWSGCSAVPTSCRSSSSGKSWAFDAHPTRGPTEPRLAADQWGVEWFPSVGRDCAP